MSRRELIQAVREGLLDAADPGRAPAMQAYMKSAMPFLGVAMPRVRRVCGAVYAEYLLSDAADLDATVLQLFREATHREERYAAVQLAGHRRYAEYQTPERIPVYRTLIVEGAWWDVVDEVAGTLVGPILLAYPAEVRPVVLEWVTDDHLWLRRSSLIAQLTFKDRTDLELLTEAIDSNAADRDFFIRKAIGWALRQYARTDPDWVRGFVAAREATVSGLSRREALKHL